MPQTAIGFETGRMNSMLELIFDFNSGTMELELLPLLSNRVSLLFSFSKVLASRRSEPRFSSLGLMELFIISDHYYSFCKDWIFFESIFCKIPVQMKLNVILKAIFFHTPLFIIHSKQNGFLRILSERLRNHLDE